MHTQKSQNSPFVLLTSVKIAGSLCSTLKAGWIYLYKDSKGSKTHVTMQDVGLYIELSWPVRRFIQYIVATCLCTVAWRKCFFKKMLKKWLAAKNTVQDFSSSDIFLDETDFELRAQFQTHLRSSLIINQTSF